MSKKLSLVLVVASSIMGGVALAPRAIVAGQRCHKLTGKGGIRSTVVAEGCTSPVGLCTAGVFEVDGVLAGTTSFVADGLAPAAGMPGTEAPTTLAYTGLLTITTQRGALTTRDTGIFDTAAGLFSSRDVIVAGTGIFAGATGHLFFAGTGTSTFESDATGEICLAD
jgi:hypothetical protein